MNFSLRKFVQALRSTSAGRALTGALGITTVFGGLALSGGPSKSAGLNDIPLKHTCASAQGVVWDAEAGNSVDPDDLAVAEEKVAECTIPNRTAKSDFDVYVQGGIIQSKKTDRVTVTDGPDSATASIDNASGFIVKGGADYKLENLSPDTSLWLTGSIAYAHLTGEASAEDGNVDIKRFESETTLVTAMLGPEIRHNLTEDITFTGSVVGGAFHTDKTLTVDGEIANDCDCTTTPFGGELKESSWDLGGAVNAGIKWDLTSDTSVTTEGGYLHNFGDDSGAWTLMGGLKHKIGAPAEPLEPEF